MLIKIPLFGKCVHKLLVARLCRSLSMMIRGGVPIAYAIELTAAVSGNMILRKAMMDVHDKVVNGMSLSESIGESWLFPNLVMRMVSVGESSGKLPQVLDKVGETYENEVEGSIMVAMALFEPVIIVVFGAIILMLVLAVYMPVFSVASGVK
jgi:type IV pilus assembly protein PilC